MQVLNSTYYNQQTPKIVELNDKLMCINGQMYDKTTLMPIPFDFFQIAKSNSIFTKTRMTFENRMAATYNSGDYINISYNNYMIDSDDPNIFYVLINDNTNSFINKYLFVDNKINLISTFVSGMPYHMNILLQTEDYLICRNYTLFYNGTATYSASFIAIDKSTMKIVHTLSLGGHTGNMANVNILKTQGHYFYVSIQMSQIPYADNFMIYEINLNAKTNTVLYREKNTDAYTIFCSPVTLNDWHYALIDTGIDHQLKMKRFKINEDNIVSVEIIPIDYNGYWELVLETNPLQAVFELNVLEKANNTYIVLSIYTPGAKNNYLGYHKNIVFRIEQDKMVITDCIKFNVDYRGMLPYLSLENLLFANFNSFDFYKFNSIEEKYELVFSKIGTFQTIGIDSLNRIYFAQQDSFVEMIESLCPIILKAKFENDHYEYTGIDITTNIIYYCKDHLDQFTSQNIKLKIIGNAVFQENGLSEITKISSPTGALSIPVIIKGKTTLDIAITLNT